MGYGYQATEFVDPTKVAGAVAAQGAGADGRTVLTGQYLASTLKTLTGVTQTEGGNQDIYSDPNQGAGDAGPQAPLYMGNEYVPGSFSDQAGHMLTSIFGGTGYHTKDEYTAAKTDYYKSLGLDPSEDYVKSPDFDNPSGNGSHDMSNGYYRIDDKGNAIPITGTNRFSPGSWTDGGKQSFINMLGVLTAGAANGAFSAAGQTTASTAAGANATNAALADSAVGSAGYGASSASAGITAADAAAAYKTLQPVLKQAGLDPLKILMGAVLGDTPSVQPGNKTSPEATQAKNTSAQAGIQQQLIQAIIQKGLGKGSTTDLEPEAVAGMNGLMNTTTAPAEMLQAAGLQHAPGMISAGNIDMNNRPQVANADGSVSTVRSIGVNIDGEEVLIPTVSDDGRIMSTDEAVAQYRKTGKNLGKFVSPEAATAFAEQLHKSEEAKLNK